MATYPLAIYLFAGNAAQNICLEATALSPGTVTGAGFIEEQVKRLIQTPQDYGILYVMPVGQKGRS